MKYVLLIYRKRLMSKAERAIWESATRATAQLEAAISRNRPAPPSRDRSVRVRDGKPLVTDGPFAETREQLGGFFLINAQDLDEAIAIAAQIPCAQVGTVEIRPVIEVAGLPNINDCTQPQISGETCMTTASTITTHEAQIRQLIADQQRHCAKEC